MAKEQLKVIGGIDTHADTHHVAVITETGLHLADGEFPAAGSGYQGIIDFMTGFGPVLAAGVEGTGSYGGRTLTRTRPPGHARRGRHAPEPAGPPAAGKIRSA
jgi:transposase